MVTLKEVGHEAGVSAQTVSRAISGKGYVAAETRTRVNAAIRRLGYAPNRVASSMATGRTMSIGMVVPDISYSFFPEIVLGAETEARQAGYNLILCNTAESEEQERRVIEFLHEARVDGIIMGGARLPDSELLMALTVHRHFVSINHPVPSELGGSIRSDHVRGIAQAVDLLLQSGRRTLAYMSGPEHIYAAQERLRGFMQAIKNAGLQLDPTLIVPYSANLAEGHRSLLEWLGAGEVGTEGWHEERATLGQRGALRLLRDHPSVDGVICYDDVIAVGALQACAQLGLRVPNDVAITGCNDLPIASQVTPRLTTQRIPRYQMGATAARMLIERIGGCTECGEVVLQHQLIVRESAPAPARLEREPLHNAMLDVNGSIRRGRTKRMDSRLKVGVAGLGVGRGHAETFLALSARFELVAVCDADEAKAKALATALVVPIVCRDFTELCNLPDLDVVDICTPSFLHFAQTQEALAAGKHVILEKPVAGSLLEVDELIAAEARSGKRVLPIFQYRFGHGAQKLRYLVQQGIAGQAFVATTETHWRRRDAYYAAWHGRWERELGGPIVTLAVHAHDVITSVLGPVRRVFATMATRVNPIETEDCVAATLEMTSGALVTSSVTTGSAQQISRMRFCFNNLTAESNTEPYTQTSDPWSFTGDSPEIDRQIADALAGFTPQPERFAGQFLSFCDALTGASEPPVTLADARASIELITALYHSAQTGLPVDLPIGMDHPKYSGWRPAS